MNRFRAATVIGCVAVCCAGASWAQSNITLTAEADTCIRENSPGTQRATAVLEVRSRPNADSGRQNVGYVRFDLRELVDAPQTGVVFSITRTGGVATTAEVVQIYGLLDTFGNTPQGWLDTGLTYNSSGLEVPGDGDATTQDLDVSRLQYLGVLPVSSSTPETLSVSGAALDSFLTNRYANGGLATLMVVEEADVEREQQFANLENTNSIPASLQVVGDLQAIPPDTTPPTVAGSNPLPGATDVRISTAVTATFSELMDPASITNGTVFTLLDGASPVPGTFAYNAATFTMTLTPDALLDPTTVYTATVSGGVTDAATNALGADFSWTFTTESDTVPPTVTGVSPTNGTAAADAGTRVQVTFNEDMNPASITGSTFYLEDASGNMVATTTAYDAGTLTATLYPTALLNLGKPYTATVVGGPGGVTDLIGNPLAADYSWGFTVSEFVASIRILPDADAYLTNDEKDGPNNTHGGKNLVEVRWHPQRVHMGYVRYDISGIAPALLSSATLQGTFATSGHNGPGTWNIYGVDDGVAGNDWDESSINYATAAGVDPLAPINSFGITNATLLGTITLDGDDVQPLPFVSNTDDLDLTAFLDADTDGLVTFILISETQDGLEYRIDSRNNAAPADGHGPMALVLNPPSDIIDFELVAGPSIQLTWGVRTNHTYGLERTTDSLTSSNWVSIVSNLVGESVNTYTDTAPVAVQAAYRVIDEGEIPPTVYFSEDFESDPFVRGWTVFTGATHQAGTDWEWGTPTSGPGAAQDGIGAVGTNLGGDFAPLADTSLLSPVIDMTGASVASLYFGNYYDCDPIPFDGCEVYVRDENGAVIAGLELPIDSYDNFITAWATADIVLPEAALDRTIRLEFRFYSDDGGEYAGWYLDNILVSD